MRVRKSLASVVLVGAFGIALTLVAPYVLPERYFFDADNLRDLIADPEGEWSASFVRTAAVYRALGFGSVLPHWLAGPTSFLVSYASTVIGAGLATARWRRPTFLMLLAWGTVLALVHGMYSKEPIAVVMIAAMLALARSPGGVLAAMVVALGYALTFRTYWAVIVALWLVLLGGWRMGLPWLPRLVLVAVAVLPLSEASVEVFGYRLSDGRTVTVEDRLGEPDSATVFFNPLANTSAFADLANTAAGWFTLTVPIMLILIGSPQHVGFALFQVVNTVIFIRIAASAPRPEPARPPTPEQWQTGSAIAWCVAYTIVQGMFEPDFGSFVKHEANLLPMFLFLLARNGPQMPAVPESHGAGRVAAR